MINENNKLIFIHIGKTGGTSISKCLNLKHLDETKYYTKKELPKERRHLTALEVKGLLKDDWDKFFKFAVVRNPWDKAVSQYFYQARKGLFKIANFPINDWIIEAYIKNNPKYTHILERKRKIVFGNQLGFINDKSGKLMVDFIMRFENLQNDFDTMCDIRNLKRVTLPRLNTTDVVQGLTHVHYSKLLNEESVGIISEKCSKDIEFFGYRFEKRE